jgi:hypothetical protein
MPSFARGREAVKLDMKEIDGYNAAYGLKLLKPAALAGRKVLNADR